MKDLLNALNLADDAIEIFVECLGKIPLTYKEIHEIKSHLSKNDFRDIFNQLVEYKLLINVVPEGSNIIPHYLALPPFAAIYQSLGESEVEEKKKVSDIPARVKSVVKDLFKDRNVDNGLDVIIHQIEVFKKKFEDDSSNLRQEVQLTLDSMHTRDDSSLYYFKFEENVKKLINTQFANILEIILQIDQQSAKIPALKKIPEKQWDEIKQDIKKYMAKSTHEMALQLDSQISEKFMDIKNYFASKLAISMEEQFGQKAVDLGILKIVIEQVNDFFKFAESQKKIYNDEWDNIASEIGKKVGKDFQEINKDTIQRLKDIESFFPQILESYFTIDDFWRISSIPKVSEEISNIIKKSDEEIIIIVPKIQDYIPLDILRNSFSKHPIKIYASDPHEDEIAREINKYQKVEYYRIEKNKTVAIKGAGILIIGFHVLNQKDIMKSVNGFGTIYQPLIDLINPIILQKIMEGRPPARVHMNNNFNFIIENINDIKGRKISQLMQENMEVASKLEGISLNLLELKILISKLKNIRTPLGEDEVRNNLIEKIKKWNKDFTSLELSVVPKYRAPIGKEKATEEEIKGLKSSLTSGVTDEEFGKANYDLIEPLFELLFEKIDSAKGSDLSKQLQDAINTVLQVQGYSIITTWKDELGSSENSEKMLEDPFKEKLKNDLLSWKEKILKPQPVEITSSQNGTKVSKLKVEDIDLEGYVSPGMSQSQEVELEGYISPGMNQFQENAAEEYVSPGLSQEQDASEEVASPEEVKGNELKDKFEMIITNINTLKGNEISSILQDIGDLLVEEHGYMATKDIRPWISKLKSFRGQLEDDFMDKFLTAIVKMKAHFVKGEQDNGLEDYTPGFAMEVPDVPGAAGFNVVGSSDKEESELLTLFNKVLADVQTEKANKLPSDLQNIADIIMQTKGALAARNIRPWISKLRAIREQLDEDTKAQFIKDFEEMRERFC